MCESILKRKIKNKYDSMYSYNYKKYVFINKDRKGMWSNLKREIHIFKVFVPVKPSKWTLKMFLGSI